MLGHVWLNLGQEAFEGGEAPNTPVVTLEGYKSNIFNFMKGESLPHHLLIYTIVLGR